MDRYAIFVDAGYLYAAGSSALTGGQASPRHDLSLDCARTVQTLCMLGSGLTDADDLLRIYWYDGALAAGLTTDQTTLGYSDNVKLRLGVVNGLGQQKGVDSRIVTDLAELARKRAITDAVLVSGDEDLRIGVEIAQEYGVRVHLLFVAGNHPAPLLRREADTTCEIDRDQIRNFLTIANRAPAPAAPAPVAPAPAAPVPAAPVAPAPAAGRVDFNASVQDYLGALDAAGRQALGEAIRVSGSVPQEHDGRLLARTRTQVGRELAGHERAALRQELRTQLGI